jgi:outer membrane protein assembly factor BamB/TolA-binding protein
MTTSEFLKELENHQLVPADVMKKIRNKVDRTDKEITAKSIARYLIDKGYLSRYQARQILTGATRSGAEEELELQVPAQQVEDTNELLKDLLPKAPAAEPEPDKTRTPVVEETVAVSEPPVAGEPVVEAEPLPGIDEAEAEPLPLSELGPADVMADHAEFDPLGEGLESHFGTAAATESSGQSSGPLTFQGKRAKRNQWDSKWIYIGSALLALLAMLGVILAFTIFKADSARLWEQATDKFNKARYSAAMSDLELYIKNFPGDPKVPDARVKIANCQLRIAYDANQWETTLTRAKTVLPELQAALEKEEQGQKFDDLRSELGVILPGAALGFTNEGLSTDDVAKKERQLGLATEMMELIDQPAYIPGSERRKPGVNASLQLLADNISKIQRQIKMEKDYATAVDSMNSLTGSGDTRAAFRTYQDLTSLYPELKVRPEIQEAMLAISLREADLVETINVDLPAASLPEFPVAASVTLATRSGQPQIPGMVNEMLVHLVDGSLYGIRAADGHVLWRKYVGVETRTEPVWLEEPNKSDVIAVDSRRHDLLRISATDGSEIWRVHVAEPFARPNVTADGLLVTTHSGKVMLVDPVDGSAGKAAQLPKDCTVSGVMIEGQPFIYQIASDSNVYVISTETMGCREVYYLGHDAGSVSVRPFVVSGHLLVPVNAANYCSLHVLKPMENGLKLDEVQAPLRLTGQVNSPLVRYNRWALVISDAGDLQMIEVNRADEEQPVIAVVRQKLPIKGRATNYLIASSGQLWISGAAGIRRFKIQKAAGQFKEEGVANNLDFFTGPISLIGENLFHIRRRNQSSLVSVSAVNQNSLAEIWRTDFAAPLAGPPISEGSRTLAISAQGDIFEITDEVLEEGSANTPELRGSTVVQSLVFDHVLQLGGRYVATGPLDRRSILTFDPGDNPPSRLTDLQPPADQPACDPVAFAEHLLVATRRGQVFRIDPLTGQPVGAPFSPPLSPGSETRWRTPLVVEDGKRFLIGDDSGRIFLVQASEQTALTRLDEVTQPGNLVSPLTGVDGKAFGVSRDDSGDRLFAIPFDDQLQVTGQAILPGGYVAGPFAIDATRLIVLLDTGQTACFDSSLQQQWVATLPPGGDDQLAGSPTIIDDRVVMAFVSGKVLAVDPATGEIRRSLDLGQPIAQPPVRLGERIFAGGADGTLHLLSGLDL